MALRDTLQALFEQARKGQAQEELAGGLTVRASWDGDLRRVLLIREGESPSSKDCRVVASHARMPWVAITVQRGRSKGNLYWVLLEECPEAERERRIEKILQARQVQDRFWIRHPGLLLEKLRAEPDAVIDLLYEQEVLSLPEPLPDLLMDALWDALEKPPEGPQGGLFEAPAPAGQFDPLQLEKGGGKHKPKRRSPSKKPVRR